jgi:tripartite-type tricarboxylate transporter receptor subunit TctC
MSRSQVAVAGCLVLACGFAAAQRYPEKPVRMVVPFQPGGGSDRVGRALARGMSGGVG